MSFKTEYPDFAPVAQHIRRAQAERSVAIAVALADAIVAATAAVRRLTGFAPAAAHGRKPLVVKANLARPLPRY